MIETKITDNDSINKQELLELTKFQQIEELGRELNEQEIKKCERITEWLANSFATKHFLAYEKDKLVGWLGAREVVPPTILLYENHPIITTNEQKKETARKLILECIKFATKKKIANIRVFVDVTEAKKKRFSKLKQYYLHAGMIQTHTVLCMESKLTKEILHGIKLDSEYHVELAEKQTEEALKKCYEAIFTKSLDNFTNSLDVEERKYWNTIKRGKYNDASKVIKKNDEVVALILAVDYGDFMELGPIGVVAEHRGKKLGKMLMEVCLAELIKQKKLECYLEVDQTNSPAINLYKTYGFNEVSKKHGFLYRIKTDE